MISSFFRLFSFLFFSQLNEIGSRHKNTEIKIKEIVAEAEKDIKNSNLEKEKVF